VLAEVEEVSGLASGIVRAGDLDIEVLRIGAEAPAAPQGYGLGFTADVPLTQAAADLRERGFATSAAVRATAGGRRATEAIAGGLTKIPAIAKAATRKAGGSMVVVTEYGFDAAAWRAKAAHGPDVYSVEVGTGGRDWARVPLQAGPLQLQLDGPPGIHRVTLDSDAEPFMLGAVAFEFNSAA
jgi:hypothetical protein